MKLYFGNVVTTVTTLMILSLAGFVGYSISNRSSINFLFWCDVYRSVSART